MSLIDELLQGPSAKDKFMTLASMMSGPNDSDPSSLMDVGGFNAPPGRGIFGNDEVDVLGPNDPRLVDRYGLTLARPAMKSLTEVLRGAGYHGDAGGGYRTPQEQANLVASKPGLAAPVGSSFHQEGLAVDLASQLQNSRIFDALRQAGWNQLEGEPWHWSYGVSG